MMIGSDTKAESGILHGSSPQIISHVCKFESTFANGVVIVVLALYWPPLTAANDWRPAVL